MDYADKLDMMDDDCDIEGFPIGKSTMLNEMTAEETAEILPNIAFLSSGKYDAEKEVAALQYAAALCRKAASRELKPVVHAHKIFVNNGKMETWRSHCNTIIPKYVNYCPYCGALMGDV